MFDREHAMGNSATCMNKIEIQVQLCELERGQREKRVELLNIFQS